MKESMFRIQGLEQKVEINYSEEKNYSYSAKQRDMINEDFYISDFKNFRKAQIYKLFTDSNKNSIISSISKSPNNYLLQLYILYFFINTFGQQKYISQFKKYVYQNKITLPNNYPNQLKQWQEDNEDFFKIFIAKFLYNKSRFQTIQNSINSLQQYQMFLRINIIIFRHILVHQVKQIQNDYNCRVQINHIQHLNKYFHIMDYKIYFDYKNQYLTTQNLNNQKSTNLIKILQNQNNYGVFKVRNSGNINAQKQLSNQNKSGPFKIQKQNSNQNKSGPFNIQKYQNSNSNQSSPLQIQKQLNRNQNKSGPLQIQKQQQSSLKKSGPFKVQKQQQSSLKKSGPFKVQKQQQSSLKKSGPFKVQKQKNSNQNESRPLKTPNNYNCYKSFDLQSKQFPPYLSQQSNNSIKSKDSLKVISKLENKQIKKQAGIVQEQSKQRKSENFKKVPLNGKINVTVNPHETKKSQNIQKKIQKDQQMQQAQLRQDQKNNFDKQNQHLYTKKVGEYNDSQEQIVTKKKVSNQKNKNNIKSNLEIQNQKRKNKEVYDNNEWCCSCQTF